jgi:hypothetical protein
LSIHWPGSQSREVLGRAQPLRLKAAHLAGRRPRHGNRTIADHRAQLPVVAQLVGVVHVLVTSQPPKHRLAQQVTQQVPHVLAGARIDKRLGTHLGAAKLQQQAAVEIEPQRTPIPFTRRVRHRRPELIPQKLNLIPKPHSKSLRHTGNAG